MYCSANHSALRLPVIRYPDTLCDCCVDMVRVSVTGVVVGIVTGERRIDMVRMRQVRLASSPLSLTFHRAFDVLDLRDSSVEEALQQVLALGCDRLLSSGMAAKASSPAGLACLKRLVDYCKGAAPGFAVVAASGVNAENCAHVLAVTGVLGIHAGSAVTERSPDPASREEQEQEAGGGGTVTDFAVHQEVSVELVRELVASCTCGCAPFCPA